MLPVPHLLKKTPHCFVVCGHVPRFHALCQQPPSKCPAESDVVSDVHRNPRCQVSPSEILTCVADPMTNVKYMSSDLLCLALWMTCHVT